MIAADHITFNNDGTAWVVRPGDTASEEAWSYEDRPCDTCEGAEFMLEPDYPCPDCSDGRHTFALSVNCPTGHPSTPCEEWDGVIGPQGYGQAYNPETQRIMRAHRKVWIAANGPIPKGMVLMHLCDNPPCVRLDHLRVATRAENQADMRTKGRSASGSSLPHSKLNAEQVAEIRSLDEPHTATAARYGVSDTVVGKIRRNKIWVSPEPCGCSNGVITHRVSVVPGMVLPIVEEGPDGITGRTDRIEADLLGQFWLGHIRVALPAAARPGMWAVKLKVAS